MTAPISSSDPLAQYLAPTAADTAAVKDAVDARFAPIKDQAERLMVAAHHLSRRADNAASAADDTFACLRTAGEVDSYRTALRGLRRDLTAWAAMVKGSFQTAPPSGDVYAADVNSVVNRQTLPLTQLVLTACTGAQWSVSNVITRAEGSLEKTSMTDAFNAGVRSTKTT